MGTAVVSESRRRTADRRARALTDGWISRDGYGRLGCNGCCTLPRRAVAPHRARICTGGPRCRVQTWHTLLPGGRTKRGRWRACRARGIHDHGVDISPVRSGAQGDAEGTVGDESAD